MFKILPLLLLLGKSSLLFAGSPCSVDQDGYDRMEIPVIRHYGNGAPSEADTVLSYKGHQISVILLLGDEFEPQNVLKILIDNSHTAIYGPVSDRLYQHGLNDGTKVQCYFNDL